MNALDIASRVGAILDVLGVDYLIGGSLASSVAGEPRSTMDIDIVVDLKEADIPRFVAALGSEFYADPRSLARAARERSSANVFHAGSAFKIDLFFLGSSPFERKQMERRRSVRIATGPDRYVYTYTAEDIVLQKLRWFRMGAEQSERQWRDVLAVLRVSGKSLDREYLRRGGEAFGVSDLLGRALAEVSSD